MREKKDGVSIGKQARLWPWRALEAGFVLAAICWAGIPAKGADGQFIVNNTPDFAKTGKNLGPEDPSKVIDVTIWLNLRNRDEFDSLAKELYDPTSPNYRQWLKRADFAAKFAPTAQQAKTVEAFFSSHNLPVVAVGPENGFVRARGTIADVQRAFHVQINKFEVKGETHRANATDPYLEQPVADLAKSVSGLDDLQFHQPIVTRSGHVPNHTSKTIFETAAAAADSNFFSSHCFTGVETESFTTPGGDFGIAATYTGNGYYSPLLAPGCGYTPPEIQTAYNLTGLYKEGYDGTGQTIVIIDFCGSPTILQDANTFSARFGLPPLNSSNFSIINYPAPSGCEGFDPEINLDVEWAHAIAPGANIDLLIAGSGTFQDADEALYYAAISGLGNVISGSYGAPELELGSAELINQEDLTQIAAVFGVSANFSSGDDGDYTGNVPGVPATVLMPASSPFATAIGGVSLALNSDNTIAFQTGWGENANILIYGGYITYQPAPIGFIRGSGGGPSRFFSKPSFQSSLPGAFRQLPDISWLADPFTPAVMVITSPDQFPPQTWVTVGGTSLSCPMFSALWAIANQEAGAVFAGEGLGQAAAYLYSMPKGTITDVVPYGSPTNVTGTIYSSSSRATHLTAAELVAPLDGTKVFYSFLYNDPYGDDTLSVISLGTDTHLKTAIGWDNVTGLGTPNGKAFADYFNPANAHPLP